MRSRLLMLLFFFTVQMCFAQEKHGTITIEKPKNEMNTLEDNTIFSVVEEMPSYPGGQAAMVNFITSNVQYPDSAKNNYIQGVVYISFVVGPDGSLVNIEPRGNAVGYGCEEEAIRIVQLMPKWNPGKQRGQAVSTQMVLPIKFSFK